MNAYQLRYVHTSQLSIYELSLKSIIQLPIKLFLGFLNCFEIRRLWNTRLQFNQKHFTQKRDNRNDFKNKHRLKKKIKKKNTHLWINLSPGTLLGSLDKYWPWLVTIAKLRCNNLWWRTSCMRRRPGSPAPKGTVDWPSLVNCFRRWMSVTWVKLHSHNRVRHLKDRPGFWSGFWWLLLALLWVLSLQWPEKVRKK